MFDGVQGKKKKRGDDLHTGRSHKGGERRGFAAVVFSIKGEVTALTRHLGGAKAKKKKGWNPC